MVLKNVSLCKHIIFSIIIVDVAYTRHGLYDDIQDVIVYVLTWCNDSIKCHTINVSTQMRYQNKCIDLYSTNILSNKYE